MIVFDKLKRGALSPPFEGFVDFGDGRDLTAATSSAIKMYSQTGLLIVDAALTIVNAATNEVKYQWVAGNTDAVGNNWVELWFTFTDGSFFKVPGGDEYINVPIPTDLPLQP